MKSWTWRIESTFPSDFPRNLTILVENMKIYGSNFRFSSKGIRPKVWISIRNYWSLSIPLHLPVRLSARTMLPMKRICSRKDHLNFCLDQAEKSSRVTQEYNLSILIRPQSKIVINCRICWAKWMKDNANLMLDFCLNLWNGSSSKTWKISKKSGINQNIILIAEELSLEIASSISVNSNSSKKAINGTAQTVNRIKERQKSSKSTKHQRYSFYISKGSRTKVHIAGKKTIQMFPSL